MGDKNDRKSLLEERLKDIDTAIHSVLVGGQSYKIGSRALTRADLKELYSMRKAIQGQLDAENSIFMDDTYVAFFDRR